MKPDNLERSVADGFPASTVTAPRRRHLARFIGYIAALTCSWFAGVAGSSFVWDFIYGIGSSVIEDDRYYALLETVPRWGGVAGLLVAVAAVIALRRPALGVLVVVHLGASFAGCFGGSFGWRIGLWAYFGALAGFIFFVAVRRSSGRR